MSLRLTRPGVLAECRNDDTAPVSIVHAGAHDQVRWDRYVSSAPGASVYHLYRWREVIERSFGHHTCYLAAVSPSATVVGVLPLAQLKSRLFGNLLVSLPFFTYGGVCAGSDAVRAQLLRAAIAVAAERRVDSLELRHEDDWQQGLARKTSKVSMRLQLPATPGDLWKALGSKVRNQVQKPRKEGLERIVGREDQLDAFYDVFSANMRDLGTPVYPRSFFRNILDRFPERTWINTVYRAGMPIASGFLAGFNERMEIPWASSRREFNALGGNMLLYWSSLELAIERGYSVFDFGRSTPGEGTYRFKEQWGARPQQLFWYYWLPDGGTMPEVNPKNPRYQAAIAAWQRLPLGLTRRLGPKIVKYIP